MPEFLENGSAGTNIVKAKSGREFWLGGLAGLVFILLCVFASWWLNFQP
jgi:hypothetical protein